MDYSDDITGIWYCCMVWSFQETILRQDIDYIYIFLIEFDSKFSNYIFLMQFHSKFSNFFIYLLLIEFDSKFSNFLFLNVWKFAEKWITTMNFGNYSEILLFLIQFRQFPSEDIMERVLYISILSVFLTNHSYTNILFPVKETVIFISVDVSRKPPSWIYNDTNSGRKEHSVRLPTELFSGNRVFNWKKIQSKGRQPSGRSSFIEICWKVTASHRCNLASKWN